MKKYPFSVVNRPIYGLKGIFPLSIGLLLHKIYSMQFFSVTSYTIYIHKYKDDR